MKNTYRFTEEQSLKAKEFLNNIFNELKTKISTIEKTSEDHALSQFEPSFIYFRDTRIPEWELALWAWYEEDGNSKGCYFIGEHELLVDKFKPSRTWISTQDMDEFISLLDTVTNNPYESFAASKYYSETIEEFREKHPDINAKEDYEKSKKHEEDKRKYQKEAEEKTLSVYLPRLMESLPYLSGVALLDYDRFGGISYPRYNLYVSVSITEFKKRKLSYDSVYEDVNRVLNEINETEMKKYIDMDGDFGTKRFVVEHSHLSFKRDMLLPISYTDLFRVGQKVIFRQRENGKCLDARY